MNPTNWKKQAATRALPFLKTFARKVKRKFRPDLDDIHDVGDMTKHTETPGLWQKGLMLGLDVVEPVSRTIALPQQGKDGSFIHEATDQTIGRINPYSGTANTQDWDDLNHAVMARERGGQWQLGGVTIPEIGLSEYLGFNPVYKGMANIPVGTNEDEMAMRLQQDSYMPPDLLTIEENIAANEADKFFGTNPSHWG